MGSSGEGKGVLYFAYGSNLSPTQMHGRCPSSTPVGLAFLPGWTWLINERGFANIVPVPKEQKEEKDVRGGAGGIANSDGVVEEEEEEEKAPDVEVGMEKGVDGVYGVLYRLHPDDEAMLDMHEGVPWAYERRFLEAVLIPAPSNLAPAPDSALSQTQASRASPSGQDLGERGVGIENEKPVRVLAYVDSRRVRPGTSAQEYIGRMNRGVEEATGWGLPRSYVDAVMRPFIPGPDPS
ncbi:hypothetical protein AAE478_009491 [Parahypoxylon ruwenzoriense]